MNKLIQDGNQDKDALQTENEKLKEKEMALSEMLKEVQKENDKLRGRLIKEKDIRGMHNANRNQLETSLQALQQSFDAQGVKFEALKKELANSKRIIESFTTLTTAHILVGPAQKKRKTNLALCD